MPPTTKRTTGATTLLLVRHGATAHTAERRYSGSTGANPPLSALGEQQAAAVAARLAREAGPVAAVVSSPVRRAHQTAGTVAAALGLAVETDDDLREIDFGDLEGLTGAEIEQQHPGLLAGWRADAELATPGGESVAEVAARVAAARDRVARRHAEGTLVLVSHLYPVRLSALAVLGAPLMSVHRMVHAPTGVTELRLDGNHGELVRYNDAAHLR